MHMATYNRRSKNSYEPCADLPHYLLRAVMVIGVIMQQFNIFTIQPHSTCSLNKQQILVQGPRKNLYIPSSPFPSQDFCFFPYLWYNKQPQKHINAMKSIKPTVTTAPINNSVDNLDGFFIGPVQSEDSLMGILENLRREKVKHQIEKR